MLDPLLDLKKIEARHDVVQAFTEDGKLRRSLRDSLEQVYDIQRLTSRTCSQRATPRYRGPGPLPGSNPRDQKSAGGIGKRSFD